MIRLKQCVIVEGKYDKQKLSRLIDAVILTTDGFRIFRDREKRKLIQILAEKNGLLILTDSDKAGFLIRRHIKGLVPPDRITNVYIPEIRGKEKRKAAPSKEGLLGVEGLPDEVIREALERAGVHTEQPEEETASSEQTDKTAAVFPKITKLDFYRDGLSGRNGSARMRDKICIELNLPHYMTANSLLDILNATMTLPEYQALIKKVQSSSASN